MSTYTKKSDLLRLPPQNIEAEESVLGALMIDKDAMDKVADILSPGDFYVPANGKVYEAIVNLYSRNEPIDILSVTSKLKEDDTLKNIGGSTFLTKLINSVPTSSHIDYYAKIVHEKSILRDLIHASAEITEDAFDTTREIDEIIDVIEQKIFGISQQSVQKNFVSLKDELGNAYERIENLHRNPQSLRGVPTGFNEIDNILFGLQKSDLVILGARPSVGKTSFALDIARNAAKQGFAVGIFSLEMSNEQIIDRVISAESAVPLWKLRTGRLEDDDFHRIQNSFENLSNAPIFIEDTPSPTITQIRSLARRLQSKQKLDVLLIDYLQLITPRTSSDNMVNQITEISRGLKGLARELNIPVVALSQLSRGVEKDGREPKLSDLRESGAIEQDADVVMFLYRDKDRNDPNVPPEEKSKVKLSIAKHRNGGLGIIELFFDQDKASFKSIDKTHQNVF